MKALSIRQPWAWAIIHAGKDIENRGWTTRFRGRFLVHAAKGLAHCEYDNAADTIHDIVGKWAVPHFDELQRGGIIGSVELVDCVVGCKSPWFFGPYGFVLANPQPLPFQSMRGTLGFFNPPGEPYKEAAAAKPKEPDLIDMMSETKP